MAQVLYNILTEFGVFKTRNPQKMHTDAQLSNASHNENELKK